MKKQLLIALLAMTSFGSMQASALFAAGEKIALGLLASADAVMLAKLIGFYFKPSANSSTTPEPTRLTQEALKAFREEWARQDLAAEALHQDCKSCFVYGMGLAILGIMVIESDAIKTGIENAGKAIDVTKKAVINGITKIGEALPATNTPRISMNQAYPTYPNAYKEETKEEETKEEETKEEETKEEETKEEEATLDTSD